MQMSISRLLLGLLVSLSVLLTACSGGDGSFPRLVTAKLNDKGPIFRSMTVSLSEPGGVEIEYWTGNMPRLMMRSASDSSTSHDITLPRLRANAAYSYEIRSISGGRRSSPISTGTFQTADLPADLKAITFASNGVPTEPLTFLSVRSTQFAGGVILDGENQVVWYGRTSIAPQGATRRANGNWVFMLAGDSVAEFSVLGEQVGLLPLSRLPAGTRMHHSVAATAQNTLLFMAFEPRVFNGTALNGESIWEWNPQTDALVKRWSAFDFLDPAVDFGPRSIPTDWFHANSITIGQHGNIILSFHFIDQILSLAPDFGSIEWRLGGPRSTFPITADQAFSGQHSAREIAPNVVLLFDNGFARADGTKYSRAIEFQLDTGARTVATTWQYRPTSDIWASIISPVRRLENGNSVLTFGTSAGVNGSTGPITLHEVSRAGELKWSLVVTLPPGGTVFQGDPLRSIAGETSR